MNLVETERSGNDLHLGNNVVPLTPSVQADLEQSSAKKFVVGARPEHLATVEGGTAATANVIEDLGSEAFVHATMPHQGRDETIVIRVPGETAIKRGDNINISVDGPLHIFEAESGRRLGSEEDAE